MNILVTGSSGFVGKNLCPHLAKNGFTVYGLDYEESPDFQGAEFFQYRLGSQMFDLLRTWMTEKKITTVIHLASESHVDRSIAGPMPFVTNNVAGTLELFEACRLAVTEKVILFSTDEVGACLEEGSYTEHGMPFKCGSVYSATKAAQEVLAQAYSKTYNMEIITTRCVNIFGPHQRAEKFIPKVIKNALDSKPIPIYGAGMQLRQWVSVQHVCDVLNFLAASSHIPGDAVLHITGTREIPNIVLAHTLLSILGVPGIIEHVEDRLGHDERYALARTAHTEAFGLPLYDTSEFMSDLKKTVDYYRSVK